MVGTLPGRTQGLGLVTEPLTRDLGIGRVAFAEINLVATLVGSLFCLGIGRLIDRVGSRLVLTVVELALGVVVLAMSQATTYAGLLLLVTLTRGFGQSALSVASLALVGKWFSRRLGTAMGVYAVAMSIGFMAAFPAVGAAVSASRLAHRLGGDRLGPASRVRAAHRAARALDARVVRAFGRRRRRPACRACTRQRGGSHSRRDARRGAPHPGLLGLRTRRRGLRARGLGHRALQRVDPGRARLRPCDLLPLARGDGARRARRQLRGRSLRPEGIAPRADGGGDAAAHGRARWRFRT